MKRRESHEQNSNIKRVIAITQKGLISLMNSKEEISSESIRERLKATETLIYKIIDYEMDTLEMGKTTSEEMYEPLASIYKLINTPIPGSQRLPIQPSPITYPFREGIEL